MNINELIAIVKKKLERNINFESLLIEDKTFLHKNHIGHDSRKFHLKINIYSEELSGLAKIESNILPTRILNDIGKYFDVFNLI